MPPKKDEFVHGRLCIRIERTDSKIRLGWTGVSEARDPTEFLEPFLRDIAREARGKSITVDFSGFEYMNSATVTPILNFVKVLDAAGIGATLIYDRSFDWQRITFQAMRTVARALKHLKVEAIGQSLPPR